MAVAGAAGFQESRPYLSVVVASLEIAALRVYRWSSSAAATSLAEHAPRLPSTKKPPRKERIGVALPRRRSHQAGCRSRSGSEAQGSEPSSKSQQKERPNLSERPRGHRVAWGSGTGSIRGCDL